MSPFEWESFEWEWPFKNGSICEPYFYTLPVSATEPSLERQAQSVLNDMGEQFEEEYGAFEWRISCFRCI